MPKVKIDGVTLGLLVLASVPWLAPIIKAIEIPGVGKIELQEIKQQADEAKGAALSATHKADLALAGASAAEASSLSERSSLHFGFR
jgi:hypothetical protein